MSEVVPIKQRPFATANELMAVPTNNDGVDNYTTLQSIAESYLKAQEGFLTGSNQFDYYESQNAQGYKWQLGQTPVALGLSGTDLTADLEQNLNFFVQPSITELTMQNPTNGQSQTPAGYPYSPTYFRVFARNATANSAGFISFNSNWAKMSGSNEYSRTGGDTGLNIIHCYWAAAVNKGWYFIENVDGGLIPFDITLTPAQVLSSNTTPIEIIAAPGANKVAVIDSVVFAGKSGGTTNYSTFTSSVIRYSGSTNVVGIISLGISSNQLFPAISEAATGGDDYLVDLPTNQAMQFFTTGGNPTGGDKNIRLKGFYRIIDIA